MSASVAVYRNIYTEDRFKQAFGSDDDTSGSLRLREKLAGRCGCSRRACLHLLKQRVPIFNWLPRYRLKKWILGDTIAGLTVGILHIPQGEETSPELERFNYTLPITRRRDERLFFADYFILIQQFNQI